MRGLTPFRIASRLAFVAWIGATLAALLVATLGIIGLAGWGHYTYRIDLPAPGFTLYAGFQPSWEVSEYGEVCDEVNVRHPATDCHNLVLTRESQQSAGSVLRSGDVRAVRTTLSGRLYLDAEPGWNSLMASLYGMQVLALLILAFLLAQLWLILRAASRGLDFTTQMVGRLRVIGWTIVGWEFVEPFLWLFLSPKAHDYTYTMIGWPQLSMGSMEPGGPSLTLVAFGLLLVLLAALFRHGAELAEEHRFTV